jgi:hypothetical protein
VEAGLGVTTVSRYVSNRVGAVVNSDNQTHLQVLRPNSMSSWMKRRTWRWVWLSELTTAPTRFET